MHTAGVLIPIIYAVLAIADLFPPKPIMRTHAYWGLILGAFVSVGLIWAGWRPGPWFLYIPAVIIVLITSVFGAVALGAICIAIFAAAPDPLALRP